MDRGQRERLEALDCVRPVTTKPATTKPATAKPATAKPAAAQDQGQ